MVFSVLSMYLLQDRQATVSLSKIILMVLMSTAVAVTIGAPFASMSLWGESGAFVAHFSDCWKRYPCLVWPRTYCALAALG